VVQTITLIDRSNDYLRYPTHFQDGRMYASKFSQNLFENYFTLRPHKRLPIKKSIRLFIKNLLHVSPRFL